MMFKFRSKSAQIIGFISLFLIAVGAAYYYMQVTKDVRQGAVNHLTLIGEIKKHEVEAIYTEATEDIDSLIGSMRELRLFSAELLEENQTSKKAEIEEYLQGMYAQVSTVRNDPLMKKATVDFVNAHRATAGVFHMVHRQYYDSLTRIYSPKFREIMASNRWRNILIINTEGDIVHSAIGRGEIGRNLEDLVYENSSFEQAIRQIISPDNSYIAVGDFTTFAPIGGRQAAFIATRIIRSGKTIGYLAFQLSAVKLNEIVQRQGNHSQAIETYMFGIQDGTTEFRSNILTMGFEKQLVGYPISTDFIEQVSTSGIPVRNEFLDASDEHVLVAADMLNIAGLNWGLVSKIRLEDTLVRASREEESAYDRPELIINNNTYTDLALVHPNGEVLYSMNSTTNFDRAVSDYAVNEKQFANLILEENQADRYNSHEVLSFRPHYNAPAGFIAKPVTLNGEIKMIVVLGLSIERISDVMDDRDNIANNIDSYLVDPNLEVVNDASYYQQRFSTLFPNADDTAPNKVDSETAKAALNGESGAAVSTNYRGASVLSAYMPVDFGGVKWALLVEMERRHAQ